MKKDEIKKALSQHKNVLEMMRAANIMKQNGESVTMVNRCVTELRKEMLNARESINEISRRRISETPLEVIGVIPFQVSNLAAPVVVYDGENIIL